MSNTNCCRINIFHTYKHTHTRKHIYFEENDDYMCKKKKSFFHDTFVSVYIYIFTLKFN